MSYRENVKKTIADRKETIRIIKKCNIALNENGHSSNFYEKVEKVLANKQIELDKLNNYLLSVF